MPRCGASRRLPGRKLIFTNGSRDHAAPRLARLGIDDHFEDDLRHRRGRLIPKPEPATYQRLFAAHAVDPTRSAFFEDMPRNLVPPPFAWA